MIKIIILNVLLCGVIIAQTSIKIYNQGLALVQEERQKKFSKIGKQILLVPKLPHSAQSSSINVFSDDIISVKTPFSIEKDDILKIENELMLVLDAESIKSNNLKINVKRGYKNSFPFDYDKGEDIEKIYTVDRYNQIIYKSSQQINENMNNHIPTTIFPMYPALGVKFMSELYVHFPDNNKTYNDMRTHVISQTSNSDAYFDEGLINNMFDEIEYNKNIELFNLALKLNDYNYFISLVNEDNKEMPIEYTYMLYMDCIEKGYNKETIIFGEFLLYNYEDKDFEKLSNKLGLNKDNDTIAYLGQMIMGGIEHSINEESQFINKQLKKNFNRLDLEEYQNLLKDKKLQLRLLKWW